MKANHTRLTIPPEVIFRDLDDEAVILHTQTGRYFGLNEVGRRMWNLLHQHGQITSVYETILAEYDVDPEELSTDLMNFIQALAAHRLLLIPEN
jgi:hypothetical protein